MRLVFTPQGWEDYTHWQRADRSTLKRVNRLIDDALRDPTAGIGKPEPLKYGIVGGWSRRITEEHRLVYRVAGEDLVILQARYHHARAKVMISLPDELLAKVDAHAKEHGSTRSATLRELAQAGLQTREQRLAARMAELQDGARPHGGHAAEQIKAARPA